jgi:hypothetical protein
MILHERVSNLSLTMLRNAAEKGVVTAENGGGWEKCIHVQ